MTCVWTELFDMRFTLPSESPLPIMFSYYLGRGFDWKLVWGHRSESNIREGRGIIKGTSKHRMGHVWGLVCRAYILFASEGAVCECIASLDATGTSESAGRVV